MRLEMYEGKKKDWCGSVLKHNVFQMSNPMTVFASASFCIVVTRIRRICLVGTCDTTALFIKTPIKSITNCPRDNSAIYPVTLKVTNCEPVFCCIKVTWPVWVACSAGLNSRVCLVSSKHQTPPESQQEQITAHLRNGLSFSSKMNTIKCCKGRLMSWSFATNASQGETVDKNTRTLRTNHM